MLRFIKLEVNVDEGIVSVGAKINASNITTNVYLDSVTICTSDQFDTDSELMEGHIYTAKAPINSSEYTWEIPIADFTIDGNPESEHISVDLNSDMLFVKVNTQGNPTDVSDGISTSVITGVLYNKEIIYHRGICMARHQVICRPNREFMDYILNYNLFKFALASSNWDEVLDCWKYFAKPTSKLCVGNKCSCNG